MTFVTDRQCDLHLNKSYNNNKFMSVLIFWLYAHHCALTSRDVQPFGSTQPYRSQLSLRPVAVPYRSHFMPRLLQRHLTICLFTILRLTKCTQSFQYFEIIYARVLSPVKNREINVTGRFRRRQNKYPVPRMFALWQRKDEKILLRENFNSFNKIK